MQVLLLKVPGLDDQPTGWKLRLLEIDGKSPALVSLLDCKRNSPADFKKVMKVMRLQAGQKERLKDEKHVKKSAVHAHGDVYEIRADKGHARLMFFYCTMEDSIVICTNGYWKGQGDQSQAFARCAKLKALYEQGAHR